MKKTKITSKDIKAAEKVLRQSKKQKETEAAQRQYALSQVYAGLRAMGHNQAVVIEMLNVVVDCSPEEAEKAVLEYGDANPFAK